jgi:predicted histone-like DNA-binding protein
MARELLIKKYQYNNEKNETAYRKWFGRIVHRGTIGTEELAEHVMEHGSVYTDDVVLGVTRKLMHCIAEQLTDGYKVKLDGIGTLYLACSSLGVDDVDDYSAAKHVTGLHVRFLGDQSNGSLYSKQGLKRCRMTTDLSRYGVVADDDDDTPGGGNGGGIVNDEP